MLSRSNLNLPNAITMMRIFLVPVLVVLLLTEWDWEKWFFFNRIELAVGVFLVAAISDGLDGYLARKRGEVTTLGTLLDPIADKLLISSALIALVELDLAPAWMVLIIIGRELSITGLRAIAAGQGITIAASVLGKGKTFFQVVCITTLILGDHKDFEVFNLKAFGVFLLWFVTFMTLFSGLDYFIRFLKASKEIEDPKENQDAS